MVVLDESGDELDGDFEWKRVEKYRVLRFKDGKYVQGLFRGDAFDEGLMEPVSNQGREFTQLPFAFINTKDTSSSPDAPPLLSLAELSLAIYRGEADYRQSLHMQGQDTLVVVGGRASQKPEEGTRVGAGSLIELKQGGDAKFIGVSSSGLPEQRSALENDKTEASAKAGQLLNTKGKAKESGEALETRIAAETASLHSIALSAAAGLQYVLRQVAVMMGANPDEVSVEPNLEFAPRTVNPADLPSLMTAKQLGAPLSQESIHAWMYRGGLTMKDYEDELSAIQDEEPLIEPALTGDPNADDPNAQDQNGNDPADDDPPPGDD